MLRNIDPSATIVTDELASYPKAALGFAGHERVKHVAEEYVNERGFHTNTAESYFALLKRGRDWRFPPCIARTPAPILR